MSSCNFHVGQKVVCVDARKAPELEKGRVYTIRGIDMSLGISPFGDDDGATGVFLQEQDPPAPYDGYDSSRFRPVVTRKTDISIFTDMLKTQRTRISA